MRTNAGAEPGGPHGRASEPAAAPEASRSPAAIPDVIRVVVAGDWAMIRTGICHIVSSRPDFTVVAECSLGDVLTTVRQHRTDVLVLGMHEATALADIRGITEACPDTSVLLLAPGHLPVHERALEFGVRGVLALEQPAAMLVKAIEKVRAGEIWLDRVRTASLLQNVSHPRRNPEREKIASLTPRELEIVQLIGEGLRNGPIAERLFISPATVRNHVTSILDKLDLSDRFDLAVYAFRHGIVRFP
jgi:NarL family two-component system response regulator LiaR